MLKAEEGFFLDHFRESSFVVLEGLKLYFSASKISIRYKYEQKRINFSKTSDFSILFQNLSNFGSILIIFIQSLKKNSNYTSPYFKMSQSK